MLREIGSRPSVTHCHPNFIEVGSPRAEWLSPHVARMCTSTTYDLHCHLLLPVLLLAVTMRVMFMSGSHDLVWHEILLQTLARESKRRTFPCEKKARPMMASGTMALVTGANLTKHCLNLEPISYVCICCHARSLFEAAPVCTWCAYEFSN